MFWTSLPWVVVFGIVWIVAYRLIRGRVVWLGPHLMDRHGRLPAVVDEKHPNRRLETTVVAEGKRAGFAYEARHYPGKEQNKPFLVVSVFGASACDFFIGPGGRLAQRTGLIERVTLRHVKTGDALFDRDYVTTTGTSRDRASAYLQAPNRLKSIRALFDLGFRMIRNDGKGVDAIWTQYPHGDDIAPELIEQALDRLVLLAPTPAETSAAPASPPVNSWRSTLALTLAVVPAVIGLLLAKPFYRDQVFVDGLGSIAPWTVVFSLPLVVIMWMVLSRVLRRDTGGPLVKGLAYLLGSLSCCVLGMLVVLIVNTDWDTRPHTSHVQRIVEFDDAGPSNESYVKVVHWRDDAKSLQNVRVSREDFALLLLMTRGDPLDAQIEMEIVTRPGILGIEWIESYRILTDESLDNVSIEFHDESAGGR